MVNFNEVRICDGHTKMVIDCSIMSSYLYANMHIDSIYLDYYKNVDFSGVPSPKAVKVSPEFTEPMRAYKVVISEEFLNETDWGIDTFKDGLFFVIVQCEGVPAPEASSVLPCGFDDAVAIAAVPDWESFYAAGMQYISSLFSKCKDNCEIPAGFEQFVLLWEAFKLAVAVCDWKLASELWERMVKTRTGSVSAGSACGCSR